MAVLSATPPLDLRARRRNATRIEIRGGGTGPTGQYLNETVVPMMALVDAGYDVLLATPSGAKPHIDPASDSAQLPPERTSLVAQYATAGVAPPLLVRR